MGRLRWVLPQAEIDAAAAVLVGDLKVHPLAARVLVHRGYGTPELAQRFLSDALADLPDPLLMKGMPEAVNRLARAVLKKRRRRCTATTTSTG